MTTDDGPARRAVVRAVKRTWQERFDHGGVLVLVSGIGAVLWWPLLR